MPRYSRYSRRTSRSSGVQRKSYGGKTRRKGGGKSLRREVVHRIEVVAVGQTANAGNPFSTVKPTKSRKY